MAEAPWSGSIRIHTDGTELVAQVLGETGPLILCVHGFPDTPWTWEALAPRLHARGFRVVAPYLRGYPPSGKPADGDCSGERLGRDVLAFADALGADRFVVVGHDWGAMSAQAAAALAPERVERMVTLAIPHGGAIRPSPGLLRTAYHFFTLPLPGAAARIRRADFDPIRAIYRRWSPSWAHPEEDFEQSIQLLRQPGGIEGALGTYRSFLSIGAASRRTATLLARSIACPTLALFGADDGALGSHGLDRTHGFFTGPYDQRVLPGVGHFLHREDPEAVLPLIEAFVAESSLTRSAR